MLASQDCIPLLVQYFFCLFNKHVKTLQERLKKQYYTCSLNAWMGCFTSSENGASNMEQLEQLKNCFNLPNYA